MEKYLVKKNTSLIEALKKITANGEKHVIVIDNKGAAIGIISDGDIRRAILKKLKLTSSISKILKKKFLYFKEKLFNKKKAIEYLQKNKIFFAPILNPKKIPINFITVNDANMRDLKQLSKNRKQKNEQVIIMAGGLGTRLRPFTNVLPKPLIPFGDKTVIEHIIQRFSKFNFNKILVTLNYKSKIIKSFFKEVKLKETVSFFEEKNPLGTVGCLSKLRNKLRGDFFLTNADSIIDIDMNDFLEFHKKNNNDVTIAAALKKYQVSYGSCIIDRKGNLKSLDEKPKYDLLVNTGLYIINSRVLKFLKKNKKSDIDEFLNILLKNRKKIKIFPISDLNWKDTGDWKEFNKLREI